MMVRSLTRPSRKAVSKKWPPTQLAKGRETISTHTTRRPEQIMNEEEENSGRDAEQWVV
jgi:hypothetical protein